MTVPRAPEGFSRCSDCCCTSAAIYEANGCPFADAAPYETQPGDLDEPQGLSPRESIGIWGALLLSFAAVCVLFACVVRLHP